jgi:cellulose synthase/poly-beta-1,6-N-acetylglucosamine synthase-like glycosyltransferase
LFEAIFLILFIIIFILALFPYFVRIFTLSYSRILKSSSAFKIDESSDSQELPKISVILPVFNEEKIIVRKMQNLLSLKYPSAKFEIIVVDGCSTDNTVELVKSFEDKRVTLIQNGKREGVTQATKDGVKISTGDIVVLTDTEAMFEENALQILADDFKNPSIGAITGMEEIVNPKDNLVTQMEHTHRSFYNMFSISESIIYSTSYFRGEFAAIRKTLFPINIDSDKGILDVEIALSAIRAGYRAKCDPQIRFYGLAADKVSDRSRQKIQRATLNQECLIKNRDLLFTGNFYGRVILPATFATHMISPVLFLASILLLPFALFELPWQLDILVFSFVVICCLVPKVRGVFLTFALSQVYLLIGLLKATVLGRPKFLKQVETTRRNFDPVSYKKL